MLIAPMPPVPVSQLIDDRKTYHLDNTGSSMGKGLFNGPTLVYRLQKINDAYNELLKNEKVRTLFQLRDKAIHSFEIIENEDNRMSILSETVAYLVDSNSRNIVFENTNDDSILIKAKYQDYNYYLEIFEDEELSEGYEAVLNVYVNGQNVLLHSGSINELYEELLIL
jgi:hypothetical protein